MGRFVKTGILASLAMAAAGLTAQQAAAAANELVAIQVFEAPTIDGNANEAVWSRAPELVTHDQLAAVDLRIKAVFAGDSVYFRARYADADESRSHKSQIWVADQERYRIGTDREDTFVFKWSMEPGPVDLRVDADLPYRADIWFWKAVRTDQNGYADDKMHVYSPIESRDSKAMISKSGFRFFLVRPGDAGASAYKTKVLTEFSGNSVAFYASRQPQGSRADIRAKGMWHDGEWTIEFARKLVTNNPDDIHFSIDGRYRFGVSRYEIAGRKHNPKLEQPWYGAGEITEPLVMRFQRQVATNR